MLQLLFHRTINQRWSSWIYKVFQGPLLDSGLKAWYQKHYIKQELAMEMTGYFLLQPAEATATAHSCQPHQPVSPSNTNPIQLSSPQWMLAIFARHEGAPEGRNTEHKSFTHFIQGNSQHMKSVMTNLHCPPDHIWNQLKPRQLGIFLKDCLD